MGLTAARQTMGMPLEMPPQAYDARRAQWSAPALLEAVLASLPPGIDRALGVTGDDAASVAALAAHAARIKTELETARSASRACSYEGAARACAGFAEGKAQASSTTIPASTAAPIQFACRKARKQPSRLRVRIIGQCAAAASAAAASPAQ